MGACGTGSDLGVDMFAVVLFTFGGHTEGSVGGGDFHEAGGGTGVGGVVVRMVEFGEGVELSMQGKSVLWFVT